VAGQGYPARPGRSITHPACNRGHKTCENIGVFARSRIILIMSTLITHWRAMLWGCSVLLCMHLCRGVRTVVCSVTFYVSRAAVGAHRGVNSRITLSLACPRRVILVIALPCPPMPCHAVLPRYADRVSACQSRLVESASMPAMCPGVVCRCRY